MKGTMFKIYVLVVILMLTTIFSYRENILHSLGVSYKKIYNKNVSKSNLNKLREELDIVEKKYAWASEIKFSNKPKVIVYHHAAIKEINPEEVDALHKNKGWAGIGYHFYIRKDGTIYTGRPETAIGAHVKGNNDNTIGICVEGNLEDESLTAKQEEALEKLSVYLCLKYEINNIVGHKDLGKTLCPGENFPLEKLRKKVILDIKNYKL